MGWRGWSAAMAMLSGISAAEAPQVHPVPWTAVDGLGRRLGPVSPARDDRFVGVFYYIWHGSHGYDTGYNPPPDSGEGPAPKTAAEYKSPYVISEILKQPPDQRQWGPEHAFHHWGESRWGHYLADDEWVIRRNGQLLADAGVDVIVLDITNGYTYRHSYETICRVYTEMRAEGNHTPQIAFLAWNGDAAAGRVYTDFYKAGLHPDLWFRWQGKPLLLCKPGQATREMQEFFTIRESWAWTNPGFWFGDGRDKWPWLADTPQDWGWHSAPDKPEQVSVSTAQHPNSNKGKSFHDGRQPPPGERPTERGLYFAEQWERALEVDPEFILVTQWNEWIAQRFLADGPMQFVGEPIGKGATHFVDLYTMEYNRDIEPMSGGYGDNFYYQMVDGIRRFKGAAPLPTDGVYTDDPNDTAPRNHPGYGSAGPYSNLSGRNDIVQARVECSAETVRLSATTATALSPTTDPNWMMLFVRLKREEPHWESFHLVANRQSPRDGKAVVERCLGGWRWQEVALVPMTLTSDTMTLELPRALMEESATAAVAFDFKWSDNVQSPGDATDWMVSGDTAPNSRFAYPFRERRGD